MSEPVSNPLAPEQAFKRPLEGEQLEEAHPPQPILPQDSAVTKAEKAERNGANAEAHGMNSEEPAAKRVKLHQPETESSPNVSIQTLDYSKPETESLKADKREKVKGIALVKPE
jgi:tRNA-dihydrouridine synthase 3